MKVTTLIPAVVYIRMSSDKQEESPAIQRKEILAKFSGKYQIEKWYIDEGKSGSHDKKRRTEFLKMLKDARNAKWKVILCLNRSRFTREDVIEAAADKQLLRSLGVQVWTVEDGLLDWNTAEGRMVDSLMTEQQNTYATKLGKATLAGRLHKFEKGENPGQKTPYGLARLITNHLGEKFTVPRLQEFPRPKGWKADFIPGDAEEIKTVKWLFKNYAERDVSFHQLARELNEKGIPSPGGKLWVYQVVHELLRNVRYSGCLAFGNDSAGEFWRLHNGEIVPTERKGRTSNKSEKLIREGAHEALIDKELFQKVQKKLARKKKSGQHSQREEGFALTGVVFCGKCGKPMYGNERTNPAKHRVGVKYYCKGNHRANSSRDCEQWGIHQDDLLPFLVEHLGQEFQKKHAEMTAPTFGLAIGGDDEREAKRAKLQKLSEQYARGEKRLLQVDDELFTSLAKQLRELKDEIASLQSEIDSPAMNSTNARQWGQLLHKHTQTLGKAGFTFQPPSKLRELFHQLGAKVHLWFERTTRKGNGQPGKSYKVAKIRLQSDWLTHHLDTAHFDTVSSLMV